MNNIILHGCTFGSNFGDCLFAKLFYDECEKINPNNNLFYNNKFIIKKDQFCFSEHYKEYLKYRKKCKLIDILKCKGIVFIGGGYFGETTSSFKEALLRYYRYFKLGIYARIFRKPVAIIGVEAGPISVFFLRRAVKRLFNYANIVSVRNKESAKFLKEIGVKGDVIVTADPAIFLKKSNISIDDNIQKINDIFGHKKILLFHSITNTEYLKQVKKKIIPAINKFLKNNSDFGVVFTYDQVTNEEKVNELVELSKQIESQFVYVYSYENPTKMINLINSSDFIITTKLHVGIVGSTLSKSVISIPFNSNKILRYYNYINESERCTPIEETDEDEIYNQLVKYNDIKIDLPEQIIEKSEKNYILLDKFINEVYKK